jgi:hypothetical protein
MSIISHNTVLALYICIGHTYALLSSEKSINQVCLNFPLAYKNQKYVDVESSNF